MMLYTTYMLVIYLADYRMLNAMHSMIYYIQQEESIFTKL